MFLGNLGRCCLEIEATLLQVSAYQGTSPTLNFSSPDPHARLCLIVYENMTVENMRIWEISIVTPFVTSYIFCDFSHVKKTYHAAVFARVSDESLNLASPDLE